MASPQLQRECMTKLSALAEPITYFVFLRFSSKVSRQLWPKPRSLNNCANI